MEDLMNENSQVEKELDSSPDLDDTGYLNEVSSNNDNEPEEEINEEESEETSEEYSEDEDSSEEDSTDTEEDSNEVEIANTGDGVDSQPMLIDFGEGNIEVKDTDELKTIASKALRDKNKYDSYKDEISVLEGIREQGLSNEDLYLLVEAKKGNQQALAKLLKNANVDPYELDVDGEGVDGYKPNEYKADMRLVETKAIINNLKQDEQTFNKFNNLVTRDFDESSRTKVFQDPNLLEFVGETVKSGLYEKIAPTYMKKKLLGEDPISAYISAYDEFNKQSQSKQVDQIKQNEQTNKVKATKRKKASEGTKKTASNKVRRTRL